MNHSKLENEIIEINHYISNITKSINSLNDQIKNPKSNITEIEETNSDDSESNNITKNKIKNHFHQNSTFEKNKNYISEQSSFSRACTNITRSIKRNSSISPDSLREVSEIINKTNQNLLDKNIIGDDKEEFKINPYFRHSFHSSKSIPKKNNNFAQTFNNTFTQDNLISEIENENENESFNHKNSTLQKKKNENNFEKNSNDKNLSPYLGNNQKKNNMNKVKYKIDKLGKKLNFSPNKNNNNNTVSLSNYNSDLNNSITNKSKIFRKNYRNERRSFDFNKTMPSNCKSLKGNCFKNKLEKENKVSKNINKPFIQKVKLDLNEKLKNNNNLTGQISPRKKRNKALIFQEYKNVSNESLDNLFLIIKEINKLSKDENKNNEKINLFSDLIKNDKNFKELINYTNKLNELYKKCCNNKKFLEIKNANN